MLIVKNLTKQYKNTFAIDDINFIIESNGVIGLLGPNGSGKSTLMRILATVQIPDKGEIYFNNIEYSNNRNLIRKQLGYLPQVFGFPEKTSVITYLRFVANAKNIKKNVIDKELNKVLHLTNLENYRNNLISNFSHGMKQKLGIAQAIIGTPKLLLFDEPTAGLDPVERNNFFNIIGEMSQKSLILFSTHIIEDIQALCKKVILLKKGKITFNGDKQDALNEIENKIWTTKIDLKKNDFSKDKDILYKEWIDGDLYITKYSINKLKNFVKKKPSLKDYFFVLSKNLE